MTVPIFLKWAMVYEHATTRAVWIGKATPREWLSEGEHIRIEGAPTRHGIPVFDPLQFDFPSHCFLLQ